MSMSLLCKFNKEALGIADDAAKVEALLCVTYFESKAQYSKRADVGSDVLNVSRKQAGELSLMLDCTMCKQLLHNVIAVTVSA
jgi:hypothetical protein